jgi:hypothetical protein
LIVRTRSRANRIARLAAEGVVTGVVVFGSVQAFAGTLSLRSEIGAEYDSNANRAETLPNGGASKAETPVSSPGGRGLLSLVGSTKLAATTLFSASGQAAVRGYENESARNEGVTILSGSSSLLQGLGNSTRAMAAASYYDAFQGARQDARDFRSISPTASLLQILGPGRLSLGGGYRWFQFKPAPALDFSGPTAMAAYRLSSQGEDGAPDWDVSGSVAYEKRGFSSSLCLKGEDCPPLVSRGLRQDDFTQFALDVVRTGEHLLGAGVAFQINSSNSFGDGLSRGLAHLQGTFLLPWGLSLASRAELSLTRYDQAIPIRRDPVSGLAIASIEDEGRSTLRIELMRALGERFDVSARWIGYTNEIGGQTVRYRRQVFLLSLGVSLDLL